MQQSNEFRETLECVLLLWEEVGYLLCVDLAPEGVACNLQAPT